MDLDHILLLAGLWLAALGTARAQEGPDSDSARPWVLGLAAERDDDQSTSLLASFNWSVADDTWLTFAAGRAHSPSDRADVTARVLVAGIDHRFGRLGFRVEAERWGDPEALESTDLTGALYVQGERFRLAYERVERDVGIEVAELTRDFDRALSRTVGVDARGDGLRFRIDLADRWRAYGGYLEYDYSRDLSVLPRIDALNLLSASTLTLAGSFVDEDRRLGLEWETRRAIVNFVYARDRSAVDRSELESLDAAVLWPLAPRIDIEVNVGKSESSLAPDGWYGGILLLIYGG